MSGLGDGSSRDAHVAATDDRCAFCGEPKNDHAVMSAEVCVLTTVDPEVIEALRARDDV